MVFFTYVGVLLLYTSLGRRCTDYSPFIPSYTIDTYTHTTVTVSTSNQLVVTSWLFIPTVVPSEEPSGAPSNLVTSEVMARSFRVSWSHAPGRVEKYRVVYYTEKTGRPEEVTVHTHTHTFVSFSTPPFGHPATNVC